MRGLFAHAPKNIRQGARDDATVSVALGTTRDREGLARACLPVRENCPIVPIKATVDYILCYLVENALLLRQHIEDAVKSELVIVFLDLSVTQAIALDVKLDFAIVGRHCQSYVWLLSRPHPKINLNSLLFARHLFQTG